jgi:large subunit ribosomal protein L5
MNRLRKQYQEQIVPQLKKELNIDNVMAVPRIDKIIVNMGMGDAAKDKQIKDKIVNYMTQISGQKVQIRQAKKAIADFGIRKNDPVGAKATLRGERMFEFLDKLISIALPRVRDFQGISLNAFDEQGNYNLGISEQIIFPEVVYDTIDRIRGLQITIKVKNSDKNSSLMLLKALGMPFEKENK